jgi:tetratricopeptide (TPR) repeat protein
MQMRLQVLFLVILCSTLAVSVHAQTGEEWFEIGSAYFDNSSFTEAISAWEKAIVEDPTLEANAWYNIGLAYAGMNQYEEAIQAWDKTIALAPGSPIAYDNKGTALAILGRNEEAIEAYNEAIRLDPQQVKFQADREMLLENMKKTKSPLSPVVVLGAIIAGACGIGVFRRRR